jgi:isocitrate dehydrogenase
MATISEISKAAKEFSDTRKVLRDRVDVLEEGIRALKKRYLPGIRSAVENAKEKQATLHAAIEVSPEHFESPRTTILFGIKFGIEKQKGKIEWDDKGTVVKLIKKYFPDAWETYVKVKEDPMKKTLATLSSAELKKLGIQVTETGDAVVIRPADSEVDKLVDALLKEKKEGEEEEEAA